MFLFLLDDDETPLPMATTGNDTNSDDYNEAFDNFGRQTWIRQRWPMLFLDLNLPERKHTRDAFLTK